MTEGAACKRKLRTTIGGQALIEGIMMKGPDKTATVVRKPDGTLAVREKSYVPLKKRCAVFGWPFIRGIFIFASSIGGGVKEIWYSAEQSSEELTEEKPGWVEKKLGTEKAQSLFMSIAVAMGVILPIGLFILLPTILAGIYTFPPELRWLRALTEGVLRLLIFLAFLWATSKMKDMRRTYSYHGAEHKSIACYEAGDELTVENVRKYSRRHPRCGTSFLFVVMIVSILVFSFVSADNTWLRLALRLVLLPVVVNISYEFNRLVGRYDNPLTVALRSPGVALQSLTTNEPDDSMIEVAIDALKRVIPAEEGADRW